MTVTGANYEVTVELGSMTDRGQVRASNEDSSAALLAPNAPPGCSGLLIVCDGMGGHQAGDYASRLAVNTVVADLKSRTSDALSPALAARSLQESAAAANAAVFADSNTIERAGMGTTLTAAVITGPAMAVAHVGDSRAYLLRGGELAQLTSDHTWVAERVQKGLLSPAEADSHPKRNVLLRALGVAELVQIDSATYQVHDGDTILLCSDGLHGSVSDADIASTLENLPPQHAAQTLIDRANAAGGPDNITAIVARIRADGTHSPQGSGDATATITDGGGPFQSMTKAVKRLSRFG